MQLRRKSPWEYDSTILPCESQSERDGPSGGQVSKHKFPKVSLLTDRCGTPLCSVFHKANKSDALTLGHLLDTSVRKTNQLHAYDALIADKGYDSATCRATCEVRNLIPLISRRGTPDTHQGRYVIEQTFGILDQFRRIRVRYDTLIRNFKSFHFIAMVSIVHNR